MRFLLDKKLSNIGSIVYLCIFFINPILFAIISKEFLII